MACTRKTKTLVSTCVILSGMTNIICLLYVGWVTNYIATVYVKVQEPLSEKKLEEDKGDTLRIIERLDHLENVIKQHIQGTLSIYLFPARGLLFPSLPSCFLGAGGSPALALQEDVARHLFLIARVLEGRGGARMRMRMRGWGREEGVCLSAEESEALLLRRRRAGPQECLSRQPPSHKRWRLA